MQLRFTNFIAIIASLTMPYALLGVPQVFAGIVGEESAQVVSGDPNSLEAQIAETTGDSVFCGKSPGTLNLVEQNNQFFLVGTAHGFYREGKLICDEKIGIFKPDKHYRNNLASGFDFNKGYQFEIPPLNHQQLSEFNFEKISITDEKSIYDIAIFKIKDFSLLQRQNDQPRRKIKMVNIDNSELKGLSKSFKSFFISRRDNFGNFQTEGIEYDCEFNDFKRRYNNSKLKKMSCDTGGNSSGGFLMQISKLDNELHSYGVYFGGSLFSTIPDFYDENSSSGNFFIPSDVVIRTICLYGHACLQR